MEKEEMINVLNEVSESEGYSSWNQVLRDFEISPAKVNGMIFKATKSQITKLEARNKELEEALENIKEVMLKTLYNGSQTDPYKIAEQALNKK